MFGGLALYPACDAHFVLQQLSFVPGKRLLNHATLEILEYSKDMETYKHYRMPLV
jgi:hypothetical protein